MDYIQQRHDDQRFEGISNTIVVTLSQALERMPPRLLVKLQQFLDAARAQGILNASSTIVIFHTAHGHVQAVAGHAARSRQERGATGRSETVTSETALILWPLSEGDRPAAGLGRMPTASFRLQDHGLPADTVTLYNRFVGLHNQALDFRVVAGKLGHDYKPTI